MLEKSAALPTIVYAHAYAPWDVPPSRQKYLMKALSQHTRVFYLDCAPFSVQLHKVPRPHAEQIHDNLIVVRNAFGLRRSRWIRLGKFARNVVCRLDARRLDAIFRQYGAPKTTFFMSMPDEELVQGMTSHGLVYDCMDPNFNEAHQARYNRIEYSIAQRAQLVLCSAQSLLERLQPFNEHTFLVPNACCYEEYAPELNRDLPRPAQLENRHEPVVGFSGYVDGRVNLDLLEAAVHRLPQYLFVFAGGVRNDREEQFKRIESLPNVLALGTVDVEQNRAWVKAFDVGLIPFLPSEAADGLNTVKMWMYFAAGKPIVSTNLRESRLHDAYIQVTQTEDEFVQAIVRAVENDTPEKIEARLHFARENTWQQRAETVVNAMRVAGMCS